MTYQTCSSVFDLQFFLSHPFLLLSVLSIYSHFLTILVNECSCSSWTLAQSLWSRVRDRDRITLFLDPTLGCQTQNCSRCPLRVTSTSSSKGLFVIFNHLSYYLLTYGVGFPSRGCEEAGEKRNNLTSRPQRCRKYGVYSSCTHTQCPTVPPYRCTEFHI